MERRRISDTNASRVANGLLGQRDQEKHVRDYALAKIRQINEGAVTNSKLAPDAVTSDKIQDSEVDTDDITDDAITGNKISDGSINQNHISESFMKSMHWCDIRIYPVTPVEKLMENLDNIPAAIY